MLNNKYLDERYKIIKILGQGGMSKVYLAENIKLGTLWAIKEIHKNNETKVDFPVEPNILKKLSHPALPRIFDIFESEDKIYIVVDYIEGESLDKKLIECRCFPEATVLNWAKQLCGVLAYLHNNTPNPIIYRDMKPSNIILNKSGELKLIDFGVAREYKSGSANDTVYIGTRGYAAPEQYGPGQTNEATDVYSLGITLYHLLTGKSPNEPPYEIKPVRTYSKDFSHNIEKIILKCTRQNPVERYATMNELMADIDNAIKELSGLENEAKTSIKDKYIENTFKKLVLTVWGNQEFGCELAYMAAKLSEYNILLIDLDLLAPKADLFLNIKKYPGWIVNEGDFLKSGLDIVLDAVEKNYLSPQLIAEASLKRKDLKNLFIITGNYKLENYEYYNDDSLVKLIEKAYISFDLTILMVNKSIYDSFTVISLSKSDFNIAAVSADLDILREYNNYISFLNNKHQMPMEKTKFVAYEYDNSINLEASIIKEATHCNYAGKVSFSRKRKAYRNLNLAYAARMEKEVAADYVKILRVFNIIPVKNTLIKIFAWISNIAGKRRVA